MSEWAAIDTTLWSGNADLTVRQEIMAMVSTAVTLLFANIDQGMAFTPFAVTVKNDRELYLNLVSNEKAENVSELAASPFADQMAQRIWASLRAQAASLRAGAVLESAGSGIISKGPDSGRVPMLRLAGDHREAAPFIAVAPWWQGKDGQFARGSLRIADGMMGLFAPGQRPQPRRG